MAKISAGMTQKAFRKFLAAANQRPVDVYLVKVDVDEGGDELAFGLGGTRKVVKAKLFPSPFVEDTTMVRGERLGAEFIQGDLIVNFIPPAKEDGSAYTAAELLEFTEVWFAPITGEGTPAEKPDRRLYVRRTPQLMLQGVVTVCNWVCNPVQQK